MFELLKRIPKVKIKTHKELAYIKPLKIHSFKNFQGLQSMHFSFLIS